MQPFSPSPGVHVTYRLQHTRCNKAGCGRCAAGGQGHGPYWYAYWQEGGKLRSRYLGKRMPPGVAPSGGAEQPARGEPVAAPAGGAGVPPPLRVRTLGGFAVWRDGKKLPPACWSRRKAAELFKALLGAPEQRLHREQLGELLWPEAGQARAANNVRFTLHQLRAILDLPGAADSYVRSRGGQLLLLLDPGRQAPTGGVPPGCLDAADFQRAVAEALAGEDPDACRTALARYSGPYLPDDRYEEWVEERRAWLAQRHLALLLHRARLCVRLEREDALAAWQAVQALDPSHEEAAYAAMRLLVRRGQRGEALRAYNLLAEALREELGVRPAAAIERLRARLLAEQEQRPAPGQDETAAEGTVPLSSMTAPRPTTNLPAAANPLIGRRRDLAALQAALERSRLVTLTGIGGTGKTRLAIEVARAAHGHVAGGVWLVELAGLTEPGLVAQEVASALGLGEPDPALPALASLRAHLQPLQLLLVLDNCEHLLDACAELAGALLAGCPDIRILATSRENLGVPGELSYRVPSLSVPDPAVPPTPERLLDSEAAQLFLERARAAGREVALTPDTIQAVAQICARLDGIPLAIELAAARVVSLPVEGIAARLDDRFRLLTGGPRTALPRQRTLRAALDWSHDLLAEPERALLRRLAVFSGGWTLEAAETVCAGAGVGDWEVLDLLGSLVEKSLVVLADPGAAARYRLLETTRQYADERLTQSGEALATYNHHLQWALALAREGSAALLGPAQQEWLDRLDLEHDNLRAALHWTGLVETEQAVGPAGGLRLAGLLWRYWWMHGHLREGRRWLEDLLAAAPDAPPELRARALDGAGVLAAAQGDQVRARVRHEESLALWRQIGDVQGTADALNNLGSVLQQQGDDAGAMALHEESLALYRDLADTRGIAGALNQMGCIVRDSQHAYDQATMMLEVSLFIRQDLGDARGTAIAQNNLGLVALYQGELPRAPRAIRAEPRGARTAQG